VIFSSLQKPLLVCSTVTLGCRAVERCESSGECYAGRMFAESRPCSASPRLRLRPTEKRSDEEKMRVTSSSVYRDRVRISLVISGLKTALGAERDSQIQICSCLPAVSRRFRLELRFSSPSHIQQGSVRVRIGRFR
jgi:hypothetical protein